MRRIMCIDSPENGKTFAIVWGREEERGVSCWPAKFGRGRSRGKGRVRRYVRLAGHDKFTAWLTICPPRAAFGTEPPPPPSRPPLPREGEGEGWFDADATFII